MEGDLFLAEAPLLNKGFGGVGPRMRLTEDKRGISDDGVERGVFRRTRRRDAALPSSASGSSACLRARSIS